MPPPASAAAGKRVACRRIGACGAGDRPRRRETEGRIGAPGSTFDVVVIGAGTAGLAAAKAAQQAGARVAVVDHGPLGTLCARAGCMPSKILLRSADALAETRRLAPLGVHLPRPARLDWPAVRARLDALVAAFVDHVVRATETSDRFTLLHGHARFEAEGRLALDGADDGGTRCLAAAAFVVATGSRPVVPPIAGLDGVPFLQSDDVFVLDALPASVAVVGGGPIGVELGQFLARAGAAVDLVERTASLAGLGPGPLRDALLAPLERELRVHLETAVRAVRPDGDHVRVILARPDGASVERRVAALLLAAGRMPDLAGLELARVGVRVEKGVPVHDAFLRTTNPRVFVAGDAAGFPALLHTASLQGRAAGHNAARPTDLRTPPLEPPLRIVFSDPAVATVGLDPDEARAAGRPPVVARRSWAEQGKARVLDRTDGMAQLVVDGGTREVLGAQLVGPAAELLIHLIAYAIHFRATVDDLLALHHYHPTLAEMIPSLAQRIVEALDRRDCPEGDVAACAEMQ